MISVVWETIFRSPPRVPIWRRLRTIRDPADFRGVHHSLYLLESWRVRSVCWGGRSFIGQFFQSRNPHPFVISLFWIFLFVFAPQAIYLFFEDVGLKLIVWAVGVLGGGCFTFWEVRRVRKRDDPYYVERVRRMELRLVAAFRQEIIRRGLGSCETR
jgi:hypothetical protein